MPYSKSSEDRAVPKPSTATREQLGVRVSSEALTMLDTLRARYAELAGLQAPFSQSAAVERMIRETAKREGVSGRLTKGGKR